MFLKVPSNPNNSKDLWFDEIQILNDMLGCKLCLRPGWARQSNKPATCSLLWSPCMTLKSNLGYTLYSVCVIELKQAFLAILQWTILLFCSTIPKKMQEVVAQELSFKIRLLVRKNRKMNSPSNLTISLHLQHSWMTGANK